MTSRFDRRHFQQIVVTGATCERCITSGGDVIDLGCQPGVPFPHLEDAIRALKAEGVDTIFTLCGGHIMPLYDGCIEEGIRIVDVRHEQAAVHAADAWARLHPGTVGVAVLTAGPGVTDGVTGVANAWRANARRTGTGDADDR